MTRITPLTILTALVLGGTAFGQPSGLWPAPAPVSAPVPGGPSTSRRRVKPQAARMTAVACGPTPHICWDG